MVDPVKNMLGKNLVKEIVDDFVRQNMRAGYGNYYGGKQSISISMRDDENSIVEEVTDELSFRKIPYDDNEVRRYVRAAVEKFKKRL